jgi:ribonuclease P protein component
LKKSVRAPHPFKLTQAKEFQAVLAAPCRLSGKCFVLLALENGGPQALSVLVASMRCARLGLIASRKAARRAVDRNRAKRHVREMFRAARTDLPALDVVLQLRNDLRHCSNDEIRQELARLLRGVGARFGASSVAPRPSLN